MGGPGTASGNIRRRAGPRAAFAVCLFVLGCVAGGWLAPTRPLAATAPVPTIASPAIDQLFYSGSALPFSGTATDSSGVRDVKYGIQERVTGLWLQSGGTWSSSMHFASTKLSNPNATSTGWSASLPSLPNGDYLFTVRAFDPSGVLGTTTQEFGAGPAPTSSAPGFLTLEFGRTIWTATNSCAPLAGQPTLVDIAKQLQPRRASGLVVTSWVGSTTETCTSKNLYPTWTDLATLRDQYGWTMDSEGETHANMTHFTTQQQQTETCGSLTDPTQGLYVHGHPTGWGMYAYANNVLNAQIQTGVVENCFAFGRTYKGGRNVQEQMMPDYFQQTNSILGGTCNAPAPAPCASKTITNQKGAVLYYHPAPSLVNLMNVAGDEWVVVQMYKLVTGTQLTGGTEWDCSNSDWHYHWTSLPEMYCENDYFAAINSIPANVQTVDPAYVAQQWGVNPNVTLKPVPAVQTVSPAQGAAAGGNAVDVYGSGFTGTTGVSFGSQQGSSVTVLSDSHLSVTSPAGSGVVDVRVTTTKGISPAGAADQFGYGNPPVVQSISPSGGPTAGGSSVQITGTGFTGATAVVFGSSSAVSVTVNSDTQITATSPAGSGTVDVRVTTPYGTSPTTTADRFTYVAAPAVSGVAPNAGPTTGGNQVVISGTNFLNASAVDFGPSNASPSFTVNSTGTQITATAPAGSAGVVDVTVTTLMGGVSQTSTADQYTYAVQPQVTQVAPSSGPAAGGATGIVVTGSGFTGATAVNFGTAAASTFTVNSDTQITVTSPPGSIGTVDVTVVTPGGTSPTTPADSYTYQ